MSGRLSAVVIEQKSCLRMILADVGKIIGKRDLDFYAWSMGWVCGLPLIHGEAVDEWGTKVGGGCYREECI